MTEKLAERGHYLVLCAEGFRLQLAEALAFGKAVINSNTSTLPEVARNAAL